MNPEQIENFKGIINRHFQELDEEAQIILKGHLLLEESLYRIICSFVFNPEYIDLANLNFYTKVNLARSISLDNSKSSMWDVIITFNTLRNKIAHHLDTANRKPSLDRLKSLYEKETSDLDKELSKIWTLGGVKEGLSYTFSLCLGFLIAFENEVYRFKDFVNQADKLINPHRHL